VTTFWPTASAVSVASPTVFLGSPRCLLGQPRHFEGIVAQSGTQRARPMNNRGKRVDEVVRRAADLGLCVERVTRIELALSAWEAPLCAP
jgi:hypothetical protein